MNKSDNTNTGEGVTPCPNHGGEYDCTPFCRLCEGAQVIPPLSEQFADGVAYALEYLAGVFGDAVLSTDLARDYLGEGVA